MGLLYRHFTDTVTDTVGLMRGINKVLCVSPLDICYDLVNALLRKMDKATGLDCIPPKSLKELAYVLSSSPVLLFNASLK